jgi:gamma-glutamylcyclotransferase (GGCT)/AIG2-like uncharacterized protein YtfP
MEIKLFTYGTLMRPEQMTMFINDSKKIISFVPAMIPGKMYTMETEQFPIVIRPNEGRRMRAPTVVFGALYTLDLDNNDMIALDSYEGCSKAAFGMNLANDLYHRVIVKAKQIEFKNMIDFMNYNYSLKDETKCFVYYGNMKNDFVKTICTRDRRKNGVVWRDFFSIF